ncbi:MAG: RluA family pseudouridine synthase [Candidatus Omnitrophota bacterium]
MPEYTLSAGEDDAGKRLDAALTVLTQPLLLGLSRVSVQKLICEGKVIVDGAAVLKAHIKLKGGEKIVIDIEEKVECGPSAEDIPLEVVYDDADLAVINKPSGLVVHPAPGNREHTLVNALLNRFGNLSSVDTQRPGIVHRLDKETSGLLVVAKNNNAHRKLAKQFEAHSIKRIYMAVVSGVTGYDEDVIEVPIGRHPLKREDMAAGVAKNARYARTLYRTVKRGNNATLLQLEPFTGRTHQLRVHLAFIGHPILGDARYGKAPRGEISRLALHAKSIGFIHPSSNKFVEFSSEIPPEFLNLL